MFELEEVIHQLFNLIHLCILKLFCWFKLNLLNKYQTTNDRFQLLHPTYKTSRLQRSRHRYLEQYFYQHKKKHLLEIQK